MQFLSSTFLFILFFIPSHNPRMWCNNRLKKKSFEIYDASVPLIRSSFGFCFHWIYNEFCWTKEKTIKNVRFDVHTWSYLFGNYIFKKRGENVVGKTSEERKSRWVSEFCFLSMVSHWIRDRWGSHTGNLILNYLDVDSDHFYCDGIFRIFSSP